MPKGESEYEKIAWLKKQERPHLLKNRPYMQLAEWLRIGREYHRPCRGSGDLVKRYLTLRGVELATCAVAAIYAGAFGADAVAQRPLHYSQLKWRLSVELDLDLDLLFAPCPVTGEIAPVLEAVDVLEVEYEWPRGIIADWLATMD